MGDWDCCGYSQRYLSLTPSVRVEGGVELVSVYVIMLSDGQTQTQDVIILRNNRGQIIDMARDRIQRY